MWKQKKEGRAEVNYQVGLCLYEVILHESMQYNNDNNNNNNNNNNPITFDLSCLLKGNLEKK